MSEGRDSGRPEPTRIEIRARGRRGIGCGVFLILVGLGLLAERMGLIPFETSWLLPAVFVAWGVGEIFQALDRRR